MHVSILQSSTTKQWETFCVTIPYHIRKGLGLMQKLEIVKKCFHKLVCSLLYFRKMVKSYKKINGKYPSPLFSQNLPVRAYV